MALTAKELGAQPIHSGPCEVGLTKREEFARAAMEGILSGNRKLALEDIPIEKIRKAIITEALAYADALLAALAEGE